METIKYEMDVPKELKDIVDLLDGILEKVMAKAEMAEYTQLLGDLMTAIDGIEGVGEEIKSQYRDEAVGYLVHKLMGRLLPAESATEIASSDNPSA